MKKIFLLILCLAILAGCAGLDPRRDALIQTSVKVLQGKEEPILVNTVSKGPAPFWVENPHESKATVTVNGNITIEASAKIAPDATTSASLFQNAISAIFGFCSGYFTR